jgi:hypothetical protein
MDACEAQQGVSIDSTAIRQLAEFKEACSETPITTLKPPANLASQSHARDNDLEMGVLSPAYSDLDMRVLSPAYIDAVINRMPTKDAKLGAERRIEVAEQKAALLRLKLVMETRLRSDSPQAKGITFVSSLDDDEVLLRLMCEVDVDSNGGISEQELLDSSLLNLEMKNALRSAFACNLEAIEDTLAHIDAKDFGDYKRGNDRKMSVMALFDALDPTSSGWIKKKNLVLLANELKRAGSEELYSGLTCLASTLLDEGVDLDFLAVKRAARQVPRAAGQRIDWVRGMGLDAALARHFPPGTLEDGLAAVRVMPLEEAMQVVAAFVEDARFKILEALREAKEIKGFRSAAEANSKFEGFPGSFATLKDFHAGAEKSLNLGYPNPDTIKGIRLEHTAHPSVDRLFVTPNYHIVTNLFIEYAWAMIEESPTDLENRRLLRRALELLRKLLKERRGAEAASAPDDQILFPGEVGDSFSESLVILNIYGITAASAGAKACADAAKSKAVKLLTTDEENLRGVTILDHQTCMDRIKRSASVFLEQDNQATTEDGSLRVGVLLPMGLDRANMISDELRMAVGHSPEAVTAEVTECTWIFSRFTDVKQLRKWLEERGLDELKEVITAKSEVWGIIPAADQSTHETLCDAMVSSFVRKELRADFRAALESNARGSQVHALLRGWNLSPTIAERADWIAQVAEALNSEEQWSQVEGWVRLHRGRIQGRTRLGLKGLMAREEKKIKLYRLKDSEVLALYLYTGAFPTPFTIVVHR